MKNTVIRKIVSSKITPPFPFILFPFIIKLWSQDCRKLYNLIALEAQSFKTFFIKCFGMAEIAEGTANRTGYFPFPAWRPSKLIPTLSLAVYSVKWERTEMCPNGSDYKPCKNTLQINRLP